MKKVICAVALVFLVSCDASTTSTSIENTPKTLIKPVAGIEIENNGSLLVPPKSPNPTRDRYWWTHSPVVADFNNDGHLDIWVTGVQRPDADAQRGVVSEDTGGICGSKGYCNPNLSSAQCKCNLPDFAVLAFKKTNLTIHQRGCIWVQFRHYQHRV